MRCETVITEPRPWALGGTHERYVCGKKAAHVCTGLTEEEKEGPEMYMCSGCKKQFLATNPEYKSVTKPLRRKK